MDSLVANYGSSSEEEEDAVEAKAIHLPSSGAPGKISNFSSSLQAPKLSSSSIRSSLPPPKSSTSISSLLPPPKSLQSNLSQPSNSEPRYKKVVQFKPPLNPSLFKSSSNLDDDDDDDDEEVEKRKGNKAGKEASSSGDGVVRSSKPFILPPPKHSFGLAPSSSSSFAARRATVEADAPLETTSLADPTLEKNSHIDFGSAECSSVDGAVTGTVNSAFSDYNIGGYPENTVAEPLHQTSEWVQGQENYSYYGNDEYYQGSYGDGETALASETSAEDIGALVGRTGKRGRNEVPADIVEVKQDDLMRNRPREDQVRLTGIAFGPSYQPASSTKGKPSKLHKRKHQIGSLYFDMKQKEMELAERRAGGFLTKAQTQAKYGW